MIFLLGEVTKIEKRVWIDSGIVEELDQRQIRLLNHVLEKIKYYYRELYGTRPCYKYPLSLYRLRKLCNRSGHAVKTAMKYLANTIPVGSKEESPINYDRVKSQRNKSHRPYRIFLRKRKGLITYVSMWGNPFELIPKQLS